MSCKCLHWKVAGALALGVALVPMLLRAQEPANPPAEGKAVEI
jgi:hypothetical protein